MPPDFTGPEFWDFMAYHGNDLRCLDDPEYFRQWQRARFQRDRDEYRIETGEGTL